MSAIDESSLPWPGEELVDRVSGGLKRKTFYESGQQSVHDLEVALGVVGARLDQYASILDFGCGCGRVLVWLRDVGATANLHGTDIDDRAIRWCQENISWAEFKVNQPLPPLDYPDGHFDLVYNHSVFTHIDENYQDQWLAELRRVTRPGGHVLLTVHGEGAFAEYEANAAQSGGDPSGIREALGRDGIVFLEQDPFVGGPFPDFYHSTFHAPWYVFQRWGRFFTIKAYLPRRSLGFQDFVLLERPLDGASGLETPTPVQVVREAVVQGRPATVGGPEMASSRAALHARNLLDRGPDFASPTRLGRAGATARRAVSRVLRHHDEHTGEIERALLDALRDLELRLDARTVWGGTKITDLNALLWEAVGRQGERINRLESDMSRELRDMRRLLGLAPGSHAGDEGGAGGAGGDASGSGAPSA